jgi:hypothetical protein
MTLLVSNSAEARMLGNIVNLTAPENLVLRLYTSNTTPAETDTAGSYTEATGNGYSALTLTGASWTVATAKVGTVNTSGTAVTSASGDNFTGIVAGMAITINAVAYVVQSVTNSTNLVLTATAGTQSAVAYSTPTTAHYAEQTFTFTGALGNVYGYHLTETTSGQLKWAERFTAAPLNIANNGDQIKITPIITLE